MHVKIIAFISDLPALSKFLNTSQFNGEYGCLACLDKGEYLEKHSKRVFKTQLCELRTNESYTVDAEEAEKTSLANKNKKKEPVNGIKGTCWLARYLTIPDNTLLDPMHLIHLGVVKLMMTLWLDTKYHEKSWYLGNYL